LTKWKICDIVMILHKYDEGESIGYLRKLYARMCFVSFLPTKSTGHFYFHPIEPKNHIANLK